LVGEQHEPKKKEIFMPIKHNVGVTYSISLNQLSVKVAPRVAWREEPLNFPGRRNSDV
jgi:hypothetical protein